jgi:hypothetical protein
VFLNLFSSDALVGSCTATHFAGNASDHLPDSPTNEANPRFGSGTPSTESKAETYVFCFFVFQLLALFQVFRLRFAVPCHRYMPSLSVHLCSAIPLSVQGHFQCIMQVPTFFCQAFSLSLSLSLRSKRTLRACSESLEIEMYVYESHAPRNQDLLC